MVVYIDVIGVRTFNRVNLEELIESLLIVNNKTESRYKKYEDTSINTKGSGTVSGCVGLRESSQDPYS